MRRLGLALAVVVLFHLTGCGMVGKAPGVSSACGSKQSSPGRPIDQNILQDDLQSLKVINYYPAHDGWTYMWTRWQPQAIDADFARIASANANGVRVIVHPSVFGFPDPEVAQMRKLAEVVSIAERHGLRVQLTLFDWWLDYGKLTESKHWADAILSPYHDDPRIAFIELQNELESADPAALVWARSMIPCVREVAGAIPITISVSGSDSVPGLKRLVDAQLGLDFYDLHYYGKAALAYHTFKQARMVVGSMPLRIGETGYATYDPEDTSDGTDARWRESAQAVFFRTLALAAQENNLPPVAPWILWDFVPDAVPTTRSTPRPSLYAYGLLRVDGTEKPAMATIRSIFAGDALDTRFNNGFEETSNGTMPTSWKLWRSELAQFTRDMTVYHSGDASVRISRSSGAQDGYPAYYVAPIKPIVGDSYYTADAWVRGADATGTTRITLAWFDAKGGFMSSTSSGSLATGTTDWQQLVVGAQAPSDAVMVEIHLVSANNRGDVWFDDVTFE